MNFFFSEQVGTVCVCLCVCLDLNCVFLGANKTKIQHLLASNTPHRGGHRLRVRNKADTLNFFQLNERRGIVQNVPKAKERFLQLEFLAKQRKKKSCVFFYRDRYFLRVVMTCGVVVSNRRLKN